MSVEHGNGGSSSIVGGVVWQPGGTNSGNRYTDFDDAFNAVNNIRGRRFFLVDFSQSGVTSGSFAVGEMPAGDYDFTNIVVSRSQGNTGAKLSPLLLIPEGTTLSGLPNAVQSVTINYAGTTGPCHTVTDPNKAIVLEYGSSVLCTGTQSFVRCSADFDVQLNHNAAILGTGSGGTREPFDIDAGSTLIVGLNSFGDQLNDDAVRGAGDLAVTYRSGRMVGATQTNLGGTNTVTPRTIIPRVLGPTLVANTASVDFTHNWNTDATQLVIIKSAAGQVISPNPGGSWEADMSDVNKIVITNNSGADETIELILMDIKDVY